MAADSLNIAAGALNAYQSDIGTISNDIANVGTTGFKSQTMRFKDAFYQNVQPASAPNGVLGGINPIQSGVGVRTSAVDTDFTQGTIQTTGRNTNLAIDGEGFFIMNNLSGTNTPTYTRDGDFSLNQNGVLVNAASGLAVQGYVADTAGKLPSPGSVPTTITLPVGIATTAVGTGFGAKVGPSATDSVFDMEEGGNLNSTSWQAVANGGTAVPQTASTTIYDSLGNAHLASITYTPVTAGAATTFLPASVNDPSGTAQVPATAWQVSVSFADGTQVNGAAATAATPAQIGVVYFNKNGQYINSTGVATANAGTPVHTTGATPSTANGDEINITGWGTGNNSSAPTGSAAAPPATGPIGISFANITSLAGAGQPVTTVSQNGYSQGTLSDVSIGTDGTITGAYTNGLQKTLGQVAIAAFENQDGLTRVGGNQYMQSADSGNAQIGVGSSGRYGQVVADSLEESNVSIADQFTKLIVAQNAFVANTKSITIGNQDLQTVDNLIQ